MKIEKLTENKILIIVNSSDAILNNKINESDNKISLENGHINSGFLINVLKKAKDEYDFNTDGCKLLIESFTSDNILVFIITKYSLLELKEKSKTSLKIKRKRIVNYSRNSIFEFKDFDCFCALCEYIQSIKNFDIRKFSKKISLFLYNDTYYLVIKNINQNYKYSKLFFSAINEFTCNNSFSPLFERKLIEHSKAIIKNNAILKAIKIFY